MEVEVGGLFGLGEGSLIGCFLVRGRRIGVVWGKVLLLAICV